MNAAARKARWIRHDGDAKWRLWDGVGVTSLTEIWGKYNESRCEKKEKSMKLRLFFVCSIHGTKECVVCLY